MRNEPDKAEENTVFLCRLVVEEGSKATHTATDHRNYRFVIDHRGGREGELYAHSRGKYSVSLQGDGGKVEEGPPYGNGNYWLFTKGGGEWKEQGDTLDSVKYSVSLLRGVGQLEEGHEHGIGKHNVLLYRGRWKGGNGRHKAIQIRGLLSNIVVGGRRKATQTKADPLQSM